MLPVTSATPATQPCALPHADAHVFFSKLQEEWGPKCGYKAQQTLRSYVWSSRLYLIHPTSAHLHPSSLPILLAASIHLPPLRLSPLTDHLSHTPLTPRPHHSLEHYRSYITLPYLPLISPTPLLLVVPSKDHVCASDLQLSAYEAAREPKQLELVQGAGHFDIYEGEIWERIVSVQEEFLRRWLC